MTRISKFRSRPAIPALLVIAGIVAGGVLRPGFVGDSPGAQPASGGGAPSGSRGAMQPAITTAIVQRATVEKRIDAVGASRAIKSVTLISEATGLVEAVKFKAGDRVSAGDVLMRIDDSEQRIELARVEAQFPIAKQNAERYAALLENGAASRLESETAFNAFKALEAERDAAAYAVSQRTIRAPFDGVVGLTAIESGDYIRAGETATTIDDLSAIIVEFAAPQESASDVEPGQKVFAALAAGSGDRAEGTVTAIDTRVDPASRTLKVEATFPNEDAMLLPGASYEVTTTNEGAPALAMPGIAVQWDRTGAYVWALGPEGEAERKAIRILQRRDETVIAEGDIEAGDRIVVEGADRVRHGMTFSAGAVAGSG